MDEGAGTDVLLKVVRVDCILMHRKENKRERVQCRV